MLGGQTSAKEKGAKRERETREAPNRRTDKGMSKTFLSVHALFVGLTDGQVGIVRKKVEAGGGSVSTARQHQRGGASSSKVKWETVTHIIMDKKDDGLSMELFLEKLQMPALPAQIPPVVQLSWVSDSERKKQLQSVDAPTYSIRISTAPAPALPPSPPLRPPQPVSPRAYLASLTATHQNENIVTIFQQLLKYASPDKGQRAAGQGVGLDNFRFKSYNQCIVTLRRLPKIRSISDVAGKGYTGFGASNLDKIRQILETGTCQKLLEKQSNKREESLRVLTGVHGIGHQHAVRLLDEHGCSTLDDLRALVQRDPTQLSKPQKIGLMYYEDIETGITMHEVHNMLEHVRRVALTLDSNATLTLCGSACRIDPTVHREVLTGDIDIIVAFDVTHDESQRASVDHNRLDTAVEKTLLNRLVELLTKEGILTHHLSGFQDSTSYLGLCVDIDLPVEKRLQRRIDIRAYATCVVSFATLSYQSSMIFNRAIRVYAKKYRPESAPSGMYISDLGLFKSKGTIDKYERCLCKTQQEVFATLGLQWRPPWQRLSADDLVPITENDEACNRALGVAQAEEGVGDEGVEEGEEGAGEKRKSAGGGWGGQKRARS